MIKECKRHGLCEHSSRKDRYGGWKCRKCMVVYQMELREKRKNTLVQQFGGRCQVCGYNKYIGSLEFHHFYPEDKKFCLDKKNMCKACDLVIEEAKKCILVCANCHAEIEAGLVEI